MKKLSYKIALGGVIASLALLLMFMTGFGPFFTYICPAFAGCLLTMIVIEISPKWAFVTYAAISILSIFTTPDKEATIIFIFLLGYYPIAKSLIERMKKPIIQWIIKFGVFNVSVISAYWLIINVFGMGQILEDLGDWGKYGIWIFLAFANVVFVVYDIFLTTYVAFYIKWFRPNILKKIK
ncbi:MAG: hypothetical protein RR540_07615 [Oscillospiraceae bacterium]